MATKRIIDLATDTVGSGDYVMVDSSADGTRKVAASDFAATLDTTLTVSGRAADSKAAGDAIAALEARIDALVDGETQSY